MRKRRYILWAALIIALLMYLPGAVSRRVKAPSREVVFPFQNIVSDVVERVCESVSMLVASREKVAEKERSMEQVARLRARIRELESLERENSKLRAALNFVRRSEHELVLCRVVARGDASGWWETIRLNRGDADGISVDSAVVTADGLVGKTIAVSRHTCDVLLMTDRNCRVAARCARTGVFGVVVGCGASISGDEVLDMRYPADPCRMDYVASSADIRETDQVVTSGLGGVYPEGLAVGLVESTEQHRSGLYQSASVRPSADLQRLRYVFVVKKELVSKIE